MFEIKGLMMKCRLPISPKSVVANRYERLATDTLKTEVRKISLALR